MIREITVRVKKQYRSCVEPYAQYTNHPAWSVVEQALDDLVENQDIAELTLRRKIVGYLIKRLNEQKLLRPSRKITGKLPLPTGDDL